MIRRPYRHQRGRTQLTPNQSPPPPSVTPVITLVSTKAQIVFSAPVVVNALPIGITRQAAGSGPQLVPTGYSVDSATQITLTYAANCVATDVITIPANVPQIRGMAGGNVAAAVKTF